MRTVLTALIMIFIGQISGQTSLGLNGYPVVSDQSFSSLNSYEFNPSNYSVIKDWGFSFTYGGEFGPEPASNLYQVSAGKSFKQHFISLRYTPGYQKEFVIRSDQQIVYGGEEPVILESKYLYRELFGAGYSYKFSSNFSAGFNLRYFKQDFSKDIVTTIFSDTIYFVRETEQANYDNWKGDIGFLWQPVKQLMLNVSSVNLLNISGDNYNEAYDDFKLRQNKLLLAGIVYYPVKDLNFNFTYETGSSFMTGFSWLFDVYKNKTGLEVSVFHDKTQKPFLAGINTSLLFTTKYLDVSLSWLKYLSDRTSTGNLSEFRENGISNIINNKYSFDKLLLTANFKLNAGAEQKVKFIDLNINQNIYPALTDKYLDTPFATARAVNLTDETVEIKPGVRISRLGPESFLSPFISILPYDTAEVKFYLQVPENYTGVNPELTYAGFYLSAAGEENDDEMQKALIINSINAWDGQVGSLRYFIKRDLDFSVRYTREVISAHKQELDTVISALVDYHKARLLFEALVRNLSYTSDPRSSAEYVQYPQQTLELKGGDCDDLSVCYSSLLESTGIETALVDYRSDSSLRHVNVLFNTRLSPQQAPLITENDSKYILRKNEAGEDEVWIPVETTSLSGFSQAWSAAADKFNRQALNEYGLAKSTVEIIDVY